MLVSQRRVRFHRLRDLFCENSLTTGGPEACEEATASAPALSAANEHSTANDLPATAASAAANPTATAATAGEVQSLSSLRGVLWEDNVHMGRTKRQEVPEQRLPVGHGEHGAHHGGHPCRRGMHTPP